MWLAGAVSGSLACGGAQSTASTTPTPAEEAESKSASAPTGKRRAPEAKERFALEQLFRHTERIRGLRFKENVPVEVHDRIAIVEYLQTKMQEDELDKSLLIYSALGLLDPNSDVKTMLENVLGEQILGYYDDEKKTFVIRDDIMEKLGTKPKGVDETRAIIVHEMVHALQDQHLDLGHRFRADKDSDPANAYRALVEGDASLAMVGYIAEGSGAPLEVITANHQLASQLMEGGAAMSGSKELDAAPAILRVTLIAAYLEGLRL
ncbi:MAG: hypothetical protein KC416_16215, partial [Myxococcales bacterium]|nr:hypothetical protein [Myxococcales bacterium]